MNQFPVRRTNAFKVGVSLIILATVMIVSQMGTQLSHARSTASSQLYLPLVARNMLYTGSHLPMTYGPYRDGQSPGGNVPSSSQIDEDMRLILQDTRLIRTYGACNELGQIPSRAQQFGLFLDQGVEITITQGLNDQEMNCYHNLVGGNTNIVKGTIGNEIMLTMPDATLANYINQAKMMGNVPVSSAERWNIWCNLNASPPRCPGRPALTTSVDFILAHIHPYWEAVPIENAAAYVTATYVALRVGFPGKEVIVGETGWPTCGDSQGNAVPSLENQKRFIEEIWQWSNLHRIPIMYFEAFDETWKVSTEGAVGGCWGLNYSNRTPKHTNLNWSVPVPPAPPTTTSVQIDYPRNVATIPTRGNCTIPVFGKVFNAGSGWHVKVEVFTDQWYTQTKWYLSGLAPIVDGQWSMPDIYLGGQGQYNNHDIRATLVDGAGSPVTSDLVTGIVRTNPCAP